MRIFLFFLSLLLCVAVVGCGEDEGSSVVSDAAALHEALENAGSGDTVRLEPGTYEGSFSIPAGVSLIGDAGGGTVLSFEGEGPVLEVSTAAGKTSVIQDLTVEGGASGGVEADGGGNLEISDLDVSVSGSVGVMVKGLAALSIANLSLSGNVSEADKDGVPIDPDPDRYAIVGLALVKVGQVDISQLTAQGFAAYGVVLYESPTVWDGGEVHHLVGTGIQAAGPVEVTLKNLRVHHIWQGATPFGYGIVASHEVHLVTESVTVEDSGLAGMLMDHSTGQHTDIKIRRSGSRGIWIQHCKPKTKVLDATAVEFTGLENQLDDIAGVAFGVFMSEGISLSNAQINETKKISMAALGAGEAEIGDGIELIGSNNLEFNDVTLHNNERAGVVVDGRTEELTESDTTVTFNNVEISGDGDRGFAEQNGAASSAPEVVTPALQQADVTGGFLDVAAGLDVTNLPDPEGYIDVDI